LSEDNLTVSLRLVIQAMTDERLQGLETADFSTSPLVEVCENDRKNQPPLLTSTPRGRAIVAVAVSLLGLCLVLAWIGAQHDMQRVAVQPTDVLGLADEKPQVCAAEGEECMDSKCCVPGGPKGLTCYAKDKDANWAACAASCKPGVHEPEKEGTWDANGQFRKAEWSCKELGKPSEPGCESFEEDHCPSSYCMKKGGSCVPKCDSYGTEDGCWKSKQCMWQDNGCMEACWAFDSEHACQPTNKCFWTGKKCQMGWWLFNTFESCPGDLGYFWNGTCSKDPCSAPGEDCTDTQCCSEARGGSGMTCFQKNKYWATCKETCDEGNNWTCDAIGERAKYSPGCAWAGKNCASEKLCCNRGFVCAVKDYTWTACVQTKKQTTWVTQNIPIPSGWDGTVVGGGRDEYQMQPAGPNDKKMGGRLYCFMAFLPKSYEEGLVDVAKKNKASIFACDGHGLFHTWQTTSGAWDTGEATLTNTDVFINVWQQVAKAGDYLNYDWTAKVDPDCVLVPDRLRDHLYALNMPEWAAVYVKNNGMDPGMGNNGFLGAVEVFSKKAVTIYLDNDEGCKGALGLNAGEDGFMKGCMDALGIGFALDTEMFFPDRAAGACSQGQRAAFHPLKDPNEWKHCWDIVLGNLPY
jgi:hypothetical protein